MKFAKGFKKVAMISKRYNLIDNNKEIKVLHVPPVTRKRRSSDNGDASTSTPFKKKKPDDVDSSESPTTPEAKLSEILPPKVQKKKGREKDMLVVVLSPAFRDAKTTLSFEHSRETTTLLLQYQRRCQSQTRLRRRN